MSQLEQTIEELLRKFAALQDTEIRLTRALNAAKLGLREMAYGAEPSYAVKLLADVEALERQKA